MNKQKMLNGKNEARKRVFRKWEHVVKSWFKWFSLSVRGKCLFCEYVSFDERVRDADGHNDGINCRYIDAKKPN